MSSELTKINETKSHEDYPYFVPKVDVEYNEKENVVYADMPGVDNENVDVQIVGNKLTLTGKNTATIPEGFTPCWQEYKLGNYRKTFTMTDHVDIDKVTASMKDGVLTLTLPNKAAALPHKVKVKAG